MGPQTRTFVVVTLVFLVSAIAFGQQPISAAQHDAIQQQYLNLPLDFEANRGQAVDQARYVARANGYGIMLEPDAIAFVLPGNREQSIVRLSWVGAGTANVTAEQPLAGRVNYMHGKDVKQWITAVPTFGRVRYSGIYRGVDAIFYGNQRQVEYDLAVAPGADVSRLAFHVDGAERVTLSQGGDLVVTTERGELTQHVPVVYQTSAGKRVSVPARYELRADGAVQLVVGKYDMTRELVVDPTLSYSTYLGGSGDDTGNAVTVDGSGRAYVTGQTRWGFPTKSAFQGNQPNDDAFVTKFWATGGGLIYSTYIGGSGNEGAVGLSVDSSGAAYITGTTDSSDFPTTAGAFQQSISAAPDVFVTKLSASGSSLVWSSYLGGSFNDFARALAIDSQHRVYVVGMTVESGGFPIVNCFSANGGWGFVTRFNADGKSLSYSCPFGGRGGVGGSYGASPTGVFVDSSYQAYVTGSVGAELETTPGAYQTSLACDDPSDPSATPDAFVIKLSATGSSLVYGTYLGGCGSDQSNGIFVDGSGNAYVAGYSLSTNFPTTSGAYQRSKPANVGTNADYSGFVTKLNAAGTGLLYSTYLHGSGGSQINGITVDSYGRAYVTGHIYSGTFPLSGAIQTSGSIFVTKLWATGGGVTWSTRLGGSNTGDTANAIVRDGSSNVYITGQTFSSNFKTTTGAFDRTLTGPSDAFVVKLKQ